MQSVTEHSSTILVELPTKDVSKKMEVFYNPLMVSNRNISITLLNALSNKSMNIALPLAGSGIRALRFLHETRKGKINHVFVNDKKEGFVQEFEQRLQLNSLSKSQATITNQEASLFLLNQVNSKNKPEGFCGYFDYIDIDPFGSPNPFLSAAIARISRNGVLAVTATDTAALSGTYSKVTRRKYWAEPLRNYMMHEVGLRILIRKIQLLGVQFEKALVPVLAYHRDHYFRLYLRCEKGKTKCDEILQSHQYFLFNSKTLEFTVSRNNTKEEYNQVAGPLWVGKLFEKKLLAKMVKENTFLEEQTFLEQLYTESKIDVPGFYDLHQIDKVHKIGCMPMSKALGELNGVRTHFSDNGVKTNKSFSQTLSILQNKQKKK